MTVQERLEAAQEAMGYLPYILKGECLLSVKEFEEIINTALTDVAHAIAVRDKAMVILAIQVAGCSLYAHCNECPSHPNRSVACIQARKDAAMKAAKKEAEDVKNND